MNHKVKKLLAMVMIVCMVFALAACKSQNQASGSSAKTAPVEITFTNFSASGGNEETLAAMYEEFQKVHPDIKVNIETIGYDDYFTQMQTRVAGGTAADCYELNIENFAAYSSKGILAEISDVDTAKFNQTALGAFAVDGKQYGLPGSFSNVVLFYNKDLFDQAGMAYPTDAWTWDDAQAAAEAIRALSADTFGIYVPATYHEFYKVSAQYGGSLLNDSKTEFTIDSPENLTAATLLVERITKTNVMPTSAQLGGMGDWDLFESGRLGMIVTGIWAFAPFAEACDFPWDISVEPGGIKKATHFFSNAFVVNEESKNKEAAAAWINFLASSDETAAIRIKAGWDLPAIVDESVLNEYLKLSPPENRQAVFDSLDYLVTPPIIEEYSLMTDIISKKLEAAASGKLSVAEALKQAQEECGAQITLK